MKRFLSYVNEGKGSRWFVRCVRERKGVGVCMEKIRECCDWVWLCKHCIQRNRGIPSTCIKDVVPGLGNVTGGALVVWSNFEAFLIRTYWGVACHGISELSGSSWCWHEQIELVFVSSTGHCKVVAKAGLEPLLTFIHRFKFFGPWNNTHKWRALQVQSSEGRDRNPATITFWLHDESLWQRKYLAQRCFGRKCTWQQSHLG